MKSITLPAPTPDQMAYLDTIHRACTDYDGSVVVGGPKRKSESGWLVEWPTNDNFHVRWWHPKLGWVMDAAKAMRFARKEDAEAYAESQLGLQGRPVTEHIFL